MRETPLYAIEHRCPQCGAPVLLNETDRLLTCPFCRVRLLFSFEDLPRYYLPAEDEGEALFFVPYWRSRGMQFSVKAGGIEESFRDRTWNATRYPCFPLNLGIKPRVLRPHYVDPEAPGRLLPVEVSFDDEPPPDPLPPGIDEDAAEQDTVLFRTLLRDSSGLIYLPAFVKADTVYAGGNPQPLGRISAEKLESVPFEAGTRTGFHFIPALCPNCGNHLDGEKESLVLFCRTCLRGYRVAGKALRGIRFLTTEDNKTPSTLLPFWKIDLKPAPSSKEGDRALTRNTIEILHGEKRSFWVPAFKVNPRLFLRLSSRITTVQPQTEPTEEMVPAMSIGPVTMPESEALEMVKPLLALSTPNRESRLQIKDLVPEAERIDLVLVPFDRAGPELVNSRVQASVHLNALKYGQNL